MAGSTEAGAQAARTRALAVLRIRSTALAVALLPAAVAVVLLAGTLMGRIPDGSVGAAVRPAVTAAAVLALLLAALVAAVVARARPALSPTVPIPEGTAPDLYRLVRDLADRLDVPAPSAIALTPDCDSWLEDRTHPAHGPASIRTAGTAPVLVIGSPFLWWMRVAELRALLAPVVAGTGPAANPDIAAARRFVRGLDAAVAVAAARPALAFVGWVARLLLRSCRDHAAEMERGVAAAASERAQTVDYGLRIVAQEQVGLAYAGWDRLLNRVALPAWRMGRWPSRLDAGVVSALTELSRRDRLAEGFASRLGERPACDLLEEPGLIDEAASLLAARLFHGGPTQPGPDWSPVTWTQYPEEVVDRTWRLEAARLHRVLDGLEVLDDLAACGAATDATPAPYVTPVAPTVARVLDRLTGSSGSGLGEELEARLSAEVAREASSAAEAARAAGPGSLGAAGDLRAGGLVPLFPLQPPRSGRELLTDHVTALVCCAAVDTAGAVPGLDWLDGPALLVGGIRRADLARTVLSLIDEGDGEPLRAWLGEVGVRPEKPVRLV